jgi:hypothetical protein
MSDTALLLLGGAVTLVVFMGLLAFGLLSFGRWSARDSDS